MKPILGPVIIRRYSVRRFYVADRNRSQVSAPMNIDRARWLRDAINEKIARDTRPDAKKGGRR